MRNFIKKWLLGETKAEKDEETFNESDYLLKQSNKDLKRLKVEREKVLREIEIEKAKAELEKVRYEIELLREDMAGEYEEEDTPHTPESLLTMLLASTLQNKNQQPIQQTPLQQHQTPQTAPAPQPTEEELRKIKEELPNIYIERAKNSKDEDILKILNANFPLWNYETLNKAIKILRE